MRGDCVMRSAYLGCVVVIGMFLVGCSRNYSTTPTGVAMVDLPTPTLSPTPPEDTRPPETISITAPTFLEEISGGELVVEGYSEYFFEANLAVTVCGMGGSGEPHRICGTVDNVLAEGYAMIDSPDMGIGGTFRGTVNYIVTEEMRARVVVFAVSPMDGGIEHLASVVVTLRP